MSNADWYAAKFAGQKPAPTYTPPSYPSHPQVPQAAPSKARSAALQETCPECDSENYFRAQHNTALRCYDCGYPLIQSGSGVGAIKDDGVIHAAKQVPTGGFNPYEFVGRIE